MEILAERILSGEYVGVISIISFIALLTLIVSVGLIIAVIKDGGMSGDYVGIVVMSTMFLLSTALLITVVKEGPKVEYTAKVTDYNEIYEQGYEIVRHEGNLVILTKESR